MKSLFCDVSFPLLFCASDFLDIHLQKVDMPPPAMPVDFSWASKLGLIRKPTNFICSISDDRGAEAVYNGIPISKVLEMNLGVGGVIGLRIIFFYFSLSFT